jgi:isochorismate synthase EntC
VYEWRKMSPELRELTLRLRKKRKFPWHYPPHLDHGPGAYHFSAACYEHKPVIGASPERLAAFEGATAKCSETRLSTSAGTGNLASTSHDNTVTYTLPLPPASAIHPWRSY